MKVRTACPFLYLIYNLINIVNGLNVTLFSPSKMDSLVMGSEKIVSVMLCNTSLNFDPKLNYNFISMVIDAPNVASVVGEVKRNVKLADGSIRCKFNYTIRGNLLGRASAKIVKSGHSTNEGKKKRNLVVPSNDAKENNGESDEETEELKIIVVKGKPLLSKIFTISVAILVSLTYVNMGCSLDLEVVKSVIKKPLGPIVGLTCQYLCMPLIAYGFGQLFFPDKVSIMKMGLFTLGCSPGGGASNMWTYLLGGNLNLSITMTFISTVAALGLMPFWLFTLGRTLFEENEIAIPFQNIVIILFSLIVPVGIGCLLKRFFPRFAKLMHKLLAPFSIFLIIYIVSFAIYINLYIFKFFNWQVVLGSTCTIWSGFLLGTLASLILRFPKENIIAIAVETGIQNTGIAFILLSSSLPAPDGDIAAVVPVAASVMMPGPLIILFIYQKINGCIVARKKRYEMDNELNESETKNTLILNASD